MVRLRSFGKRIIGVVTPALLAIFVLCQIVVSLAHLYMNLSFGTLKTKQK